MILFFSSFSAIIAGQRIAAARISGCLLLEPQLAATSFSAKAVQNNDRLIGAVAINRCSFHMYQTVTYIWGQISSELHPGLIIST